MPDDKRLNRQIFDAFDVGFTRTAMNTLEMSQNPEDLLHDLQTSMTGYIKDQNFDYSEFKKSEIFIDNSYDKQIEHAALDPERIELPKFDKIDMENMSTVNITENVFKNIQKVFSGRGAIAMLGFAGITMAAGVFGGAPTAPPPATGQAQGISQENAMYELPSTISDGAFSNTSNQGYIINVNASTSEGREFAENAINQAFANNQATNKNNSITMNIKDSSSNISYRDIASYISSML
jgi:hypothetical protein